MTSFIDIFQLVASNLWYYGGIFIIVLSILVFVHEWGHYIVARMCGVRVETFSIGFGKEIFGHTDTHGTRWKLSLIPLGGYVKMFGDTDPASAGHSDGVKDGEKVRPFTKAEKDVAFFAKPVLQRAAIVFAGPAINFIFAIMLLFGLYSFYGQPVTPSIASAIMVDSAADKAGFKPHDRVISIDGKAVSRFEDIRLTVTVALDTPLEFVVQRGDKQVTLTATPDKQELKDHFGFMHSRGMLGIIGPNNGLAIKNIISVAGRKVKGENQVRRALLANMGKTMKVELDQGEEINSLIVKLDAEQNAGLRDKESKNYNALIVSNQTGEEIIQHGMVNGITSAVNETWTITAKTLQALGQIFTGTRSVKELGGIIRISAIAGDMAQAGFVAIVMFTALLSINLGLINLFPIPMLDGGHLVFYALEAIRRKPVSERIQEYAFRVGFVILVGFMLFANLNDVFQLVTK